MKKLLSLLLIALLMLSFAACGAEKKEEPPAEEPKEVSSEPAKEEKEEPPLSIPQQISKNCIDAMFVPDMQAVFNLIHPKLMEYSRAQKNMTDEQFSAMIDQCNLAMQSSIDDLNDLCNDWEIDVEFLSQTPLSDVQLASLKRTYSLADITVSGGTLLTVRINAVVDGEKIPLRDTTFSCIRIMGRWYLDAAFTELVPKPDTPAEEVLAAEP